MTLVERKYIDWKPIISKVQEELEAYKIQGYDKPTLRSIFYRLASTNIIPNTPKGYTGLITATKRARWKGDLDLDCFADESRSIIEDYNTEFYTPDELIDIYLNRINKLSASYNAMIPRWYKQSHYIELWTEKKAMINNLVPILKDRDVTIVPTSGFNDTPFLYESYKRLKEQFDKDKEIHVLYYGDFDPSGESISEDISNRLKKCAEKFGDEIKIDFQRIAVTPDQIRLYDLPLSIDQLTKNKLENDPRAKAFRNKHGDLYQVELDALPALIPDQFREMILHSVDQFFDERIHIEMMNEISDKYSNDKIDNMIVNIINNEAKRLSGDDS